MIHEQGKVKFHLPSVPERLKLNNNDTNSKQCKLMQSNPLIAKKIAIKSFGFELLSTKIEVFETESIIASMLFLPFPFLVPWEGELWLFPLHIALNSGSFKKFSQTFIMNTDFTFIASTLKLRNASSLKSIVSSFFQCCISYFEFFLCV